MNPLTSNPPIKVALIDLYNGEPNQGIRAITEIVSTFKHPGLQGPLVLDRFETRLNGTVPTLDYDIYLLSGGPGSPFDGEDQPWEAAYFQLVDAIWDYNEQHRSSSTHDRKFALFICHSFQMMCRHYKFGEVVQRQSESFGIFKTYQTEAGKKDQLFDELVDPFYAADFRKWQVVQPDQDALDKIGAEVLAIERFRQDPAHERALMSIRINPEMVGVQFHPEADPDGMLIHFGEEERRMAIVKKYGEDSFQLIIDRLEKPEYLAHTYNTIIPNFLTQAIDTLRGAG